MMSMSLAVSGSNIFAGTDSGGVFLSKIFAGTDGGGIFLSTNSGTSWSSYFGLTNG